ncbi:MAG: thioredoxin family protein [Planctomycetota bacterium]
MNRSFVVCSILSLLTLSGCDAVQEAVREARLERSNRSDREIMEASLQSEQSSEQGMDAKSFGSSEIVLMKFGATWCPPCRMIDQELVEFERAGFPIEVRKIDVDEHPRLAQRYGISSIPRLILMRDGQKIGDKTGFMTSDQLSDWVESKASVTAGTAKPAQVQSNPFFQ